MKYTTQTEIEKIKTVFNTFLISNGFKNFAKFCEQKELNYSSEYKKLYIGNIDHDYINSLIKLIDRRFSLINFQGRFQILK